MFKLLFLLIVAAVAAWWWRGHAGNVEKTAAKVDNQATRYVSALQQDVTKAEAAQTKATTAIKQETQAAGQALDDAQGKSR